MFGRSSVWNNKWRFVMKSNQPHLSPFQHPDSWYAKSLWTKNLPPAATLFMTPRPPAPRVAPQLVPPAAAELIAMFWIKMILNNVVRGLARSDQYWRTLCLEPAEPPAEETPELSSSWSQLPVPWAQCSTASGGGRRTTPTTAAAAALATVQSRPDRDDFVVGRANSQRWTSRGLFDGSSSTGRWARLDFLYTYIRKFDIRDTYMYPIPTTTYRKNTQSYWRNPGVETVVENLRRLCSSTSM